VPACAPFVLALSLLLAGAGWAQPRRAEEQQKAFDASERAWGRTIGTLGTVYGTPLLELSILEYRQAQGLTKDVSGPRGLIAHVNGGRLPTHASRWLAPPDPDVLLSSAWLDVKQAPSMLWIPPLEGHWYSVQFEDAFANDVGVLSSRTVGSVGGWYLIAHRDWEGERPPGAFEEIRISTPVTWVLFRIAATRRNEEVFHERYQSQLKFVSLDVYARNPKAASYASPLPQTNTPPPVRALDTMRGTLDAFQVINHRLRQIDLPPAEAALLALFDRAGFGPGVVFDPAKLPRPLVDGLRDGARDGQRVVHDQRFGPQPAKNGWSRVPPAAGASGDDLVRRASAALESPGASIPAEILGFQASTDGDGRLLDGRLDYRIRFAKGRLPPAKAFWTIAAYDPATRLLLDTGTDRYSVGSLTEGLATGPDGSLEIFLSSDAPEDEALRANWLPVRTAPFLLIARLYEPEPAALDGSYALPRIVEAD